MNFLAIFSGYFAAIVLPSLNVAADANPSPVREEVVATWGAIASVPCQVVDENTFNDFKSKLERQSVAEEFLQIIDVESEIYARKNVGVSLGLFNGATVMNMGRGKAKVTNQESGDTYYFIYDDRSEFAIIVRKKENEVECRKIN